MYNLHGFFSTNKLTDTSEAFKPWIKHEGHHVNVPYHAEKYEQKV
jgi:hypothetical protein